MRSIFAIFISVLFSHAFAQTSLQGKTTQDYLKTIAVKISQVQTFEDLFSLNYDFFQKGPPPYDPVNPIGLLEEGKDRIILAGDSWAAFPCGFESMEKVIKDVRSRLKNDWRCEQTSKLGMRAVDWLGSAEDQALTEILTHDKRVKFLYLSLGGNDVLDGWNVEMNSAQSEQLLHKVYEYVQAISNKYLEIRPDLKIIVSGYDFPHFKLNHAIPLYRRIYNRMGRPTPLQLNKALAAFSEHLAVRMDRKSMFYIHHLGLAQYYDGIPPNIMAPRSTLPPASISTLGRPEIIGGNIQVASSETSMMVWVKMFSDAFHLTEQNYYYVMLHTYDNLLVHLHTK